MPQRPYFYKTTQDIAQIFKENSDDPRVLRELLVELGHRKTPSARELRQKVESRLNGEPDVSKVEVGESFELFCAEPSHGVKEEGRLNDRIARAILGVPIDAGFPEIKKAWLTARDEFKRNQVPDEAREVNFKRIKEAFQFLERSTAGEF